MEAINNRVKLYSGLMERVKNFKFVKYWISLFPGFHLFSICLSFSTKLFRHSLKGGHKRKLPVKFSVSIHGIRLFLEKKVYLHPVLSLFQKLLNHLILCIGEWSGVGTWKSSEENWREIIKWLRKSGRLQLEKLKELFNGLMGPQLVVECKWRSGSNFFWWSAGVWSFWGDPILDISFRLFLWLQNIKIWNKKTDVNRVLSD